MPNDSHQEHMERLCGTHDPDWTREELVHMILRSSKVLRNPMASDEERAIANDQLAFYMQALNDSEAQ